MKRDEAVQLFGTHYGINVRSNQITEYLGHADPEKELYEFSDLERAQYALAREYVLGHQREVDRIDGIFSQFKLRITFAKLRLHAKSAEILAQVEKLNEKRKTHLDQINNPPVATIISLQDDIKIPHMLELGQEIYVVRSTYTSERIALDQYRIFERVLHRAYSSRSGGWDYTLHYRAKNTDPAANQRHAVMDVRHDRADASDPKLDNNVYGHDVFLTREAAEEHVRKIAREMIQKVRATLRALKGPSI